MSYVGEIASANGGRCLSVEYFGGKEKMRFECAKGHLFDLSFNHLASAKRWCPSCSIERRKFQSERLIRWIEGNNGKLVTPPVEIKGWKSEVAVECVRLHRWAAVAGRMADEGTWCPVCAKESTGSRLDMERVVAVCRENGGACLDSEMVGRWAHVRVRCKHGHEWETSPFSLAYKNAWCPACSMDERSANREPSRVSMFDMLKDAARMRGGLCLSTVYSNVKGVYRFRCDIGHEWAAQGRNVLFNVSWCPECSGKLGETLVVDFIRRTTGMQLEKCRPKWLVGTKGRSLELDAYSSRDGFAVEYQGKQHYEFVPGWRKTEEYFKECQERDALKRKLCARQGVLLFEVRFVERPTKEKIENEVRKQAGQQCMPFSFNPGFQDES